ncbi:MAG: 2Fe-2S iron-sulfur cluster-binding protein [Nitrospiraceae bacterium]|nr:2Fe-2S iron-sulfur cluster-binding protein [Nitrospiraceae bacterium]
MAEITLNGKELETAPGATVLEAARAAGVDIPTLCYHEALGPYGACRLCIVEASGPVLKPSLITSCNAKAADGMAINTESPLVVKTRKLLFELLIARSPRTKPLLEMAARFGVEGTRFKAAQGEPDNCLRCGICVRACTGKIGASAIVFARRGQGRHVTAEFEKSSSLCIGCGSCSNLCPTGAIRMLDEGGRRRIFVNERVISDLPLVECRNCGRLFVTPKQAEKN